MTDTGPHAEEHTPGQDVPPATITQVMQEYSDFFDELCVKRHEAGAAEYGAFTFLGNDVIRMMAEELADTANYCRMQFIKLMFLQAALEEKLEKEGVQNNTVQFQGFKGVGDVGWQKG